MPSRQQVRKSNT